jgi:hypothetical protein
MWANIIFPFSDNFTFPVNITYIDYRMIKYLFVVNTKDKLRLVRYYSQYTTEERVQLQTDVTKLCLSRSDNQVNIKLNKL